MATSWYYAVDGVQYGPVNAMELKSLADSKKLLPAHMLWKSGLKNWVKSENVKGLFDTPTITPPPLPQIPPLIEQGVQIQTNEDAKGDKDVMEVEITWGKVVRVWWAYFWRILIAIIVSAIAGGIVGFILGFIMGAMGASLSTIQYVTAPLGVVIGLGMSVIPMKMILGKDFSTFRLVLVSKD